MKIIRKKSILLNLLICSILFLAVSFFVLNTNVTAAGPPIFINELHYDNSGTDVGEGVEIAGPANTNLSNWSLVPYNGNGGTSYSITPLSGTIPDQQNGCGTIFFSISGLQNGAPDGIALVDDTNTVIQFLSYEGSFIATDGPANGFTSVDIGVSESSSTLIGQSLQLIGSGSGYDDFAWTVPISNTYDAVNTSQTFTGCGGSNANLNIAKSVTPNANVTYHGNVTYTIHITNSGLVDENNVLMTDTLPAEVTFSNWVAQNGAIESNGTITWTGSLSASTSEMFSFVATHNGNYGEMITNTAYISGSNVNMASAMFTVEAGPGDITFVYHDLEGVIQAGDTAYVAGSFNTWTPVLMTADASLDVFTVTIPAISAGNYEYKYIVNDGINNQWDWLNTANRPYTVTGNATVHDYRNVVIDWANLNSPANLTTVANIPTSPITGQLHIPNVTDPAGEGRGLMAQIGYGTDTNPANWTWFGMTYIGEIPINDDLFSGIITPTASGIYSYATRFDGNGGIGNPNANWIYGDLDGSTNGFNITQTGVLTVTPPTVSIYDIQYTTDPSGDSPYNGQEVNTEGIVTANFGNEVFIQDGAGPWNGIMLYQPNGTLAIGDYVQVNGTITEFFGMTEFAFGANTTIISKANALPDFTLVSSGDLSQTAVPEQYESVLVIMKDVTVTDEDIGFGEWVVDDGSGAATIDDIGPYTYQPALNDTLACIQGPFFYSFGAYKLEPRDDNDIQPLCTNPIINKVAPNNVAPGALFTYTIFIENIFDNPLTNVVVSDTVPANSTFAYALNGGTYDGSTVTWNLGDIPPYSTIAARFAVTATDTAGLIINNIDYAVVASNFITPTFGAPASTIVGNYASIPIIQGNGPLSPLEGLTIDTYGVVIGFFEGNNPFYDGFFIQDPNGDGDNATSDGIFVHHSNLNIPLSIGDVVSVTGVIAEFSEWDGTNCPGDECLTTIMVNNVNDVVLNGADIITATPINTPLGDTDTGYAYYETLEGMLISQPATATVVGPTSFGTIMVIPGTVGLDHVIRTLPEASLPVGVRHFELYGDINGNDPDNLIVGSIVENVDGPLMYSYGNYLIATQASDEWTTVTAAPEPNTVPAWPEAGVGEFTVGTFNTLNFDGADTPAKMTKVISTVVHMGAPTFLALQEIDVVAVITDVLTNLNNLGYPYEYANSHADVGGHGVALIWRTDQVISVTTSTAYQGCSAVGSGSSVAYDHYCDGTGLLPLFSRRPVVLTGTVTVGTSDMQVIVIANHFKSKSGGDPADDQRRLEQAQLVHNLANDFIANGNPYVVVSGDLNDFEDSPPLTALYGTNILTNTWYTLPETERFSYIYRGVSQVLDHIVVSPSLLDTMLDMGTLHLNADFPFFGPRGLPYENDPAVVWHTSDHDVVVATFAVPETEPVYNTTFVYNDLEGVVQSGETVYIAGDFNGWNSTATPLAANTAGDVFSVTIPGLTVGTYEYKYIVNDGSDQWDWLNTNNRSHTVSTNAVVDNYRWVNVGWANLESPATLTTIPDVATDVISGQVYINNVTNPIGEGRSIMAEVGFGNDTDPANWNWSFMLYDTDLGNNDVFNGTLTPTNTGIYSYATRFDGNWGVGNPNSQWVYGDLTGTDDGFNLNHTGVLTVAHNYGLTLNAPVDTAIGNPADTVNYTVWLTNTSTTTDTFDITLSGNVWTTTVNSQVGPLATGESTSFNVIVTIDATAANNDSDTVIVMATSQGDTNISDSVSLTTTATTTPITRAVQLEASITEMSDNPGNTVNYSILLTNTGSTTDTFAISLSGNVWTTIADSSVETLAAGASTSLNVAVTIDAAAANNDSDSVIVMATSQGDTSVSDSVSLTTTATTTPITRAVQLEASITEMSDNPGNTISYTVWLTNTGSTTDTFDITLSGNVWTTTVDSSIETLVAGASTSFNVAVTIDAAAVNNDSDTVMVMATSQGDTSVSDSVSLTTTATTTVVTHSIQLDASVTALSDIAGNTVTYTVSITNTGSETDSFNISLGGNSWNSTPSQTTVGPLASNQTSTFNVYVTINANAAANVSDTVTVTATSQGDGSATATINLVTTSEGSTVIPDTIQYVYMPIVFK